MNDIVSQIATQVGVPNELVIKAVEFVGSLLSSPLKELSNIGTDQIKWLRVKNQVRLLNTAKEYCDKKGIKSSYIPAKFLFPLLEGVSLEEDNDEDMHKMWTALLLNAIDYSSEKKVKLGYIDMLKQLSAQEAKILDISYDVYKDDMFALRHLKKKFKDKIDIDNNDFLICVDNFVRLNIWKPTLAEELLDKLSWKSISDENVRIVTDNTNYKFTLLGENFIKCCRME